MEQESPAATRARIFVNAWNLSTPAGLLIAVLGRARIRGGPDGLWLAEGYRLPFPVARAFTVGNVLITPTAFDRLGPDVVAHETAHARQYMRWGWLFGPAYVGAMAWSWLRTGDRAARNHFERGAGLERGGYRDVPLRPCCRRRESVRV
ncbi:hypothetical protein [Propionicicella superfundia]|uniref:hypothetical protein n=1 Tax=Propionicicella superfundia TaxID=348582 RepID=UPI0003FA47BA|nr:hypothetical protein [Propionicicella superfundia]